MAEGIRAGLTRGEGRKFGLTVGIAFLALTGLLIWRGRESAAIVTGALGGLLVLAGLVIPTRLGPVERAWMAMAHQISKVTTPIVMGVVYFVVVTPIGTMMRLFRRNPMVREERAGSFWVTRADDEVATGGMKHQY